MTRIKHSSRISGFSFVDAMTAIAIIGILGFLGVLVAQRVKPAVESTKMDVEVAALNSALKVYISNGGKIEGMTDPDLIIAKLKTRINEPAKKTHVGFTGSTVDPRLQTVQVNPGFKGSRVVYNSTSKRFETTEQAVKGFILELGETSSDVTEESRDTTSFAFASKSGWIWDYEDAEDPEKVTPTLVARTTPAAPNPIIPATLTDPPPPESASLDKLQPPTFSLPSDYYSLPSFPLSVSLSNPNGPGTGTIYFGIIGSSEWAWTEGDGPIEVTPGDKILAYIQSVNPQEKHNSSLAQEHYEWSAALLSPQVTVDPIEMDARTGSTTITITHGNDASYFSYGGQPLTFSGSSFEVKYKLVPLVDGEGTATDWTTYSAPFDIGGPQFPRGFEVLAQVVALSPRFQDSSVISETMEVYYQLDPPTIESSIDSIVDEKSSATFTLINSNPSNSSNILYQILDDKGEPATGWMTYTSPFDIAGTDYPQGFTVIAKAEGSEDYYRDSNDNSKPIAVNFFGIDLTGATIFVLDSSGSMTTNDRIKRLREATKSALDYFNEDDYFAIIDYDTSPRVLVAWGPGDSGRRKSAHTRINQMAAGGGTNYHDALQSAIDNSNEEVKQVIFLSDGQPWNTSLPDAGSTDGILELVQELTQSGDLRRLDTISLGTIQPILSEMAREGGGDSINVPDE